MDRSLPTVIFVANRGYALFSSRRTYIQTLLGAGHNIVLATSDDEYTQKLVDMGCELHEVNFERGGAHLFNDLSAFISLYRAVKQYSPSMLFSVHAKPVIFSNLILGLSRLKSCKSMAVITGLGHAFIKGGWLRSMAGLGYKLALRRADRVVFQNEDDMALFLKHGWLKKERSRLIIGSGVDTGFFSRKDRNNESSSLKVVMLGRLIGQKGVNEFRDVANAIAVDYPSAEFMWAGEEDPSHLDSVSPDVFNRDQNTMYLGRVENVQSLIESADILLFPSYREGVPRAIMECASMGLPCVGFDVPGVREVVVNNETGYLVPFGDVESLIGKVRLLLDSPDLRQELGENASKLMKRKFDKKVIERAYFDEFASLGLDVMGPTVD